MPTDAMPPRCVRQGCGSCPACGSDDLLNAAEDIPHAPRHRTYRSLPAWPVRLMIRHRCRACKQVWGHWLTRGWEASSNAIWVMLEWDARRLPMPRGR